MRQQADSEMWWCKTKRAICNF